MPSKGDQGEAKTIMRARVSVIIILFAIFSCVGWIYETIDNIISFGGFYLRASLMLPWCPIYGIGGLVIVGALGPVRRRLAGKMPKVAEVVLICVATYLLTALIELAGSYVCEWLMGYVPWDYSSAWLNFDGRIAPRYTLRFVVMGLLAIYAVHPAVTSWARRNSRSAGILAVALAALFLLDAGLEALGIWQGVKDALVPFGIRHW